MRVFWEKSAFLFDIWKKSSIFAFKYKKCTKLKLLDAKTAFTHKCRRILNEQTKKR